MKKFSFWGENRRIFILFLIFALAIIAVYLYRLGTLTRGISAAEAQTSIRVVGVHGIYHSPLYLPINIFRSIIFKLSITHGALLTRLPNVLFGLATIASFSWLIWLWHGRRIAIFSTILFATSAWTLHVSRIATYDILYLWGITTLLLVNALLQQKTIKSYVWYSIFLLAGLLLYIPGLIWFLLITVVFQRQTIKKIWINDFGLWWQRTIAIVLFVIWLPLLGLNFIRSGQIVTWLGLPTKYSSLTHMSKEFIAVFVHLFVRGPMYPDLWLAKAPILDIFTLLVCLVGIYFYIKNWQSRRSRLLAAFFAVGVVLVSLGGPVVLSVLVPICYVFAATGLTYVLREWLLVFPRNPFARSLGITLVTIAVLISGVYNLRAYYVAWPHNNNTYSVFIYHRP